MLCTLPGIRFHLGARCFLVIASKRSAKPTQFLEARYHAVKACAGRRLSSVRYYPRRCVELHFLDTLPCEKCRRRPVWVGASGGVEQCFSTFVRLRSVKVFFFIRRGPGPNKFTRKYLSNFLSSFIKLT